MSRSKISWGIFICLLIGLTAAHSDHPGFGCYHNEITEEPALLDVDEEPLPSGDSRTLATATYPKIRMTADYSNLVQGTTAFKTYVQKELMPAVLAYFQAAFAVKQPLTSALKITTKTICGLTTPSALTKGVSTDFYLLVTSKSDSTSNFVASAGSCMLSSTTKRPIVASMLFNLYYTKPANGDALIHEQNMYLTMHEMLHAFGFTGSSFKNFIDASGKTLTGHLKTATLSGTTRTILAVEPLVTKLRAHYGCSTLQGAYLEDDGGSGTAGSHFERRHFLYEAMTSGVIQGLRLSEFSLAVMEGSGWYMPNYTYADPFYAGKGEGCGFLTTSCTSSSILNYDEFCAKENSRGCGIVGNAGGVCTSDTRSDDCQFYIPVKAYSCENADAVDYARFPSKEVYGRSAGSKCFTGDLTTTSNPTASSFCFKYNCLGSGLSTTLQVIVGTTTVTCKAAGKIKVTGLNGNLNCPDPLTFCSTIGKKVCRLNCLNRGKCVSGKCVCNTGFTGIDCAMNA